MSTLVLSPSQLEDWKLCRLRWRFKQEPTGEQPAATIAQAIGTAVHSAWEMYVQAPPLDRSPDLMLNNLELALAEAGDGVPPDGQNRARSMVRHYLKAFGQDPEVSCGSTETDISMAINERVRFHARLDYVSGGSIYELKTTSRRPNEDDYLYFNPQLRYQGLLVSQTNRPVRLHVTVLWPGGAERYAWPLGQATLDKTRVEVVELARQIEEAKIVAHEGWHCRFCPFKSRCVERLILER